MGYRNCPVIPEFHSTDLPWISLRIIAIIAITSSTCIRYPALYPINPIAQAIIKITAM
jgi:hypothetical protein